LKKKVLIFFDIFFQRASYLKKLPLFLSIEKKRFGIFLQFGSLMPQKTRTVFTWLCFARRCTHFQVCTTVSGAFGLRLTIRGLAQRRLPVTFMRAINFQFRTSFYAGLLPPLRQTAGVSRSPIYVELTSLCVPNCEVILN
jgi:hypothetical protein